MKIYRFVRALYGNTAVLCGAGILLLSLLLASAQFLSAWHLGRIMDAVGAGLSAVLSEAAYLTAAVAVQFVSDVLLFWLLQRLSLRLANLLHKRLTDKLSRAAYKPLSMLDDGELMTTAAENAEGLGAFFSILAALGQIPVKVLVVFVAIFRIHWVLFVLCLLLFPLTLLPSLLLSKKLYELNLAEQKAISGNIRFLQETFDFLIVLKAYCLEKLFARKNRAHLDALEAASLRKDARDRLLQSFARCIGYVANPLLLTVAAYLILQGDMTVGQIVSVMFFIDIAGQGINLIVGIGGQVQSVRMCMTRIETLLALPDERSDGIPPAPVGDAPIFELRGVSFAYAQEKVLRDVSLNIYRGDKVAVAGRSGSGKTTLFKLLNGLYAPDEGEVLFRGQDVAALSADALRQQLSVVPQESFVFPGTLLENVSVAKPGAEREEVAAACEAAQIRAYIETLPEGYDTPVGGVIAALSNGQMQRINLARAFLRDTDVWLLDEPTSALDAKNRDAVIDRLVHASGEKTIICILHEPELIEKFPVRVFMEAGRVVRVERRGGEGETYA
ncbi:MAG TPA: ABC transporter ATP-binding protein/permease [Firmicutes bacterium]|nr:ABC transporter ATP-binding protein/permease [Bacillota bacterium]